jgi:hypothetical protein
MITVHLNVYVIIDNIIKISLIVNGDNVAIAWYCFR